MVRHGTDPGTPGTGYVSLREFQSFRGKLYSILLSMVEMSVLDDVKGSGQNREVQRVSQVLDRLAKELEELRLALGTLKREAGTGVTLIDDEPEEARKLDGEQPARS